VVWVIETSMRGGERCGARARRQRADKVEERGKAEWRDITPIEVVERFWVWWWGL
jgi:hypothetical protein